jgi:hypothetical protein
MHQPLNDVWPNQELNAYENQGENQSHPDGAARTDEVSVTHSKHHAVESQQDQ